jgi:hypothetical protein
MDDLFPNEFYLFQNYPNPFTERTIIKYCVAYKTKVKMTVYNSYGEMVEKLVDEEKEAGTYKVDFYTKGESTSGGNPVSGILNLASGVYFYQINAGTYVNTKKMILLK